MPDITPDQRANLARLATYLEQLPADYDHFKMDAYAAEYDGTYPDHELELHEVTPNRVHTCGTSACAVGHAPLAGIKPYASEDWQSYQLRVFGMNQDSSQGFPAWQYLFGPHHFDDHRLAAQRIRTFLENDCNVPA